MEELEYWTIDESSLNPQFEMTFCFYMGSRNRWQVSHPTDVRCSTGWDPPLCQTEASRRDLMSQKKELDRCDSVCS